MASMAMAFLITGPTRLNKLKKWFGGAPSDGSAGTGPAGVTIQQYRDSIRNNYPPITKQIIFHHPSTGTPGDMIIVYWESDDPRGARDRFQSSTETCEQWCMFPSQLGMPIPPGTQVTQWIIVP